MNHPIPIEVSLNNEHSSQHLPKSLDRLNIPFWGEKFTADKSRVKLLDFAVEGKLLSTITKQITSTINLNSTKKNHKIKLLIRIPIPIQVSPFCLSFSASMVAFLPNAFTRGLIKTPPLHGGRAAVNNHKTKT